MLNMLKGFLHIPKKLKLDIHIPYEEGASFDNVLASVWIRYLQLLPYLKRDNIKYSINKFNTSADLAVFFRLHDKTAISKIEEYVKAGIPVLSDFGINYADKAIADVFPENMEIHLNTLKMIELSRCCVAASSHIFHTIKKIKSNTYHVPDYIDMEHFRKACCFNPLKEVNKALWIGYSPKIKDLTPVLPLLKKYGYSLTVVSDKKQKLECLGSEFEYEFIPWSYYTVNKLHFENTVFIAPRFDLNAYNSGHSNFKITLPLAMGIPVIASPLRSYSFAELHRSAILCKSIEQWDEALANMQEASVYEKYASNARKSAAAYSLKVWAPKMIEIFRRESKSV